MNAERDGADSTGRSAGTPALPPVPDLPAAEVAAERAGADALGALPPTPEAPRPHAVPAPLDDLSVVAMLPGIDGVPTSTDAFAFSTAVMTEEAEAEDAEDERADAQDERADADDVVLDDEDVDDADAPDEDDADEGWDTEVESEADVESDEDDDADAEIESAPGADEGVTVGPEKPRRSAAEAASRWGNGITAVSAATPTPGRTPLENDDDDDVIESDEYDESDVRQAGMTGALSVESPGVFVPSLWDGDTSDSRADPDEADAEDEDGGESASDRDESASDESTEDLESRIVDEGALPEADQDDEADAHEEADDDASDDGEELDGLDLLDTSDDEDDEEDSDEADDADADEDVDAPDAAVAGMEGDDSLGRATRRAATVVADEDLVELVAAVGPPLVESGTSSATVPAVRVRGLTKSYGTTRAVDGADLTVAPGTFYGIVGPNGAGKTTTLSLIAGLVRPDRGTIEIGGMDAVSEASRALRLVGVLPDNLRTFDRLTGAQLLRYHGALRRVKGSDIAERSRGLARAFDLTDALSRPVADYSTGMRKKILLACAMIHAPRVLILDEPFESVDPISASMIIEILTAYVERGGTVVLTSHGLDLIEKLCSSVAVIVSGSVLAEGPIDEVRGTLTLEERYVQLAGGLDDVEGLEWLRSFSD